MALSPWKKISGADKFKNSWWTYCLDQVAFPNGKRGEYHSVHTGGSVMIIPLLASGKILMVNQFRYLHNRESLEFPAGGVRDGEKPGAIAAKELTEETGYTGKLKKIGHFIPYNGISDETTYVFLATDLKKSDQKIENDDSEEFELIELTLGEIEQKIKTSKIDDGMTMASLMIFKKLSTTS
jgi:ADP-ribose pyrophosphatase